MYISTEPDIKQKLHWSLEVPWDLSVATCRCLCVADISISHSSIRVLDMILIIFLPVMDTHAADLDDIYFIQLSSSLLH